MARRTEFRIGYEDAIEDVLVVMRSEFGMWETSPLYQRVEQLKEEKFNN
jgi:hypothetical protein